MSCLETQATWETSSRKLANEELGRLLVATNLTERDRSGLVAVRLLDTTSLGRRLARGLGGELLAGGFSSGRFTRGLLQTMTTTTSASVACSLECL